MIEATRSTAPIDRIPIRTAASGEGFSVLYRFNDLAYQEGSLRKELEAFPVEHRMLILDALEFAKEAHTGKTRWSGEPFIIHPIRVVRVLIGQDSVRDLEVLAAAMLHDTVEDCGVKVELIAKRFGEQVADMVKSESKNMFPRPNAASPPVGYWEHFATAPEGERRMKFRDRCDNLISLLNADPKALSKYVNYLKETRDYMIPIAKSLGVQASKELGDLMSFVRDSLDAYTRNF